VPKNARKRDQSARVSAEEIKIQFLKWVDRGQAGEFPGIDKLRDSVPRDSKTEEKSKSLLTGIIIKFPRGDALFPFIPRAGGLERGAWKRDRRKRKKDMSPKT